MFAQAQFTHAAPLHQALATTLVLGLEPRFTPELALEPVLRPEHRLFPVARTLETAVEAARFVTFARVEGLAITL